MSPFRSAPSLVVLHTVRITGRVVTAHLPDLTGLPMGVIDDELRSAVEAGCVQHHDGIVQGWSLTPVGRQRHLELLSEERADARRDAQILTAYEALMVLNEWFKSLCTEWQLRGHPTSCIERLCSTHPQVDAIAARLADELTRFSPYGPRFSGALRRLQAGHLDAFTTPLTGSYHDVWMNLHQDLLLTLGRDRASGDGY